MALLDDLHPALRPLTSVAQQALRQARTHHSRRELQTETRVGADGTPTMLVDDLVEHRLLEVAAEHRVNVLSEEAGFVDHASAVTLVIDPVDGSANAAADVPLSALSVAVVVDDRFAEAVTCALDTGRTWTATADGRTEGPDGRALKPSGRRALTGSALSLLRPHPDTTSSCTWWALTRRAHRVRVLSCSTLDIALVAQGAVDVFADPGSDTHRLVDLAAAAVFAAAGTGRLADLHDRPITFDTDLTRRWSGVFAATEELLRELQNEATAAIAHTVPLPRPDPPR